MCGIVGLFIKDKALEPKLGAMLADMLGTMCDRGSGLGRLRRLRGAA
jgi:glutamate synthase domain-containing protein 1